MSKTFALDGFEPIKRIGGGGFGDVWLARQTNVDREVAIKVGHAPIQDKIIRLRFERECKALGRLSGHPNIVDVFTAGTLDDGRPYLVLEYIDGGTLWHRLKQDSLDDEELVAIGEQLAGALTEAHASGVLHRDLKPENILMRSNGDAVLGDFGIARLQDGVNTTSAAITASVAYAAPEVLGGAEATPASDLYGIGVCLLAAVIRSVPFVNKGDKSIHPIISRVMTDEPPDLRTYGVGEDLAKVIEILLDKDPSMRPSSAQDVQEVFESMRIGSAERSVLHPGTARKRATRQVGIGLGLGMAFEQQAGLAPATVQADGEYDIDPDRDTGSIPLARIPDKLLTARSRSDESPDPASGGRRAKSIRSGKHAALGPPRSEAGSPTKSAEMTSGSSLRSFAFAYLGTIVAGAFLIYVLARLVS